jgi:phosphate starvation-inducible membrane PsiE
MARPKNKAALRIAILLAIFLIIEFSVSLFLGDWTFTKGSWVIINNIICYFFFFGLLYCVILFYRPVAQAAIPIAVFFILICGALSFLEIFPIDTTTQPADVSILQSYPGGKKLVIRQYKNAKTNEKIQDTVLVKDVLIFRRLYHQK